MIKRFVAIWKLYDTPVGEMAELLELMVKAGRRCAYDLRHAADDVSLPMRDPKEQAQMWYDRARYWLSVFNPADDGKSYRSRLYHEICDLEMEIERLKRLCVANNIEHGGDTPF